MQLVVIDKPEIKINLVDEIDDKMNNEADEQEKRGAYLVSIITIVTVVYNRQIYEYRGV